jgi:hypothetical protein
MAGRREWPALHRVLYAAAVMHIGQMRIDQEIGLAGNGHQTGKPAKTNRHPSFPLLILPGWLLLQ